MWLQLTALLFALAPEPPAKLELQQILHTSLDDVRRTIAYYEKVVASHDKRYPFRWVLRQKRRQERRILRLHARHELKVTKPQWSPDQIRVPPERVAACSKAVEHELRNAAIYERALERLSGSTRSVFWRLHRRTRYKHLTAFERCVSKG